jgi:ORMDL family
LHSAVPRSRHNSRDYMHNHPSSPTTEFSTMTAMTLSTSAQSLLHLVHSSSQSATSTPTHNGHANVHNTTPPPLDYAASTSPNTTTTGHASLRFNSRDMPRSYTGEYQSGASPDLLPLEVLRSQQFLSLSKVNFSVFALAYTTIVLAHFGLATIIVTATSTSIRDSTAWPSALKMVCRSSWTITHAIHTICTVWCVHWLKGSYLLLDEQGELNGMTIWEQLEATSESGWYMRRSLFLVPTLLSYIACWMHNFDKAVCMANVAFWTIAMVPKLPMMNGVRLFGINRTAGIDE